MNSNKETKSELKKQVEDFWDDKSCGEIYAIGQTDEEYYNSESTSRYKLEPYIHDFAKFSEGIN